MKPYLRVLAAMAVVAAVGLLAVPHGAHASCSSAGISGGTDVSKAFGPLVPNDCIGGTDPTTHTTINPIFALLSVVIGFATGLFGLVLVLMIVIAGLEYVIAGGSADKVKGAKNRLQQAATGFVLFLVMWGALQALLPGGVFQR